MAPKRKLSDLLRGRPDTSSSTSLESLKVKQLADEKTLKKITKLNEVQGDKPGDKNYGMPFTNLPTPFIPGTKDRMPGNKYGPHPKKRKSKDWI